MSDLWHAYVPTGGASPFKLTRRLLREASQPCFSPGRCCSAQCCDERRPKLLVCGNELGRREFYALPVRISFTVRNLRRRDRKESAITVPLENERRLTLFAF